MLWRWSTAGWRSRQQKQHRAINSHYIWVTGMLQLQQADKTLLCKRDREVMGAGAYSYRGRSVYSVRHMSGGCPDNIARDELSCA